MYKSYKTTKIMCVIVRPNGIQELHECDMIYIDEVPHIVFEWEHYPDDSEKPLYVAPLDPKLIHPLSGWADVKYMYERGISDPRPAG